MSILKPSDCSTTEGYLGQFDLHNHTFSYCVNKKYNLPEDAWTQDKPHIEEKFHEITARLKRLINVAANQNTRALAITEHPQFTYYNIPFARYMRMFRGQHPLIEKVFWGLEVDLEVGKDRTSFVNEDEIGNERVGSANELFSQTQVIVGSLHTFQGWREKFGFYRHNEAIASYDEAPRYIRSRDDYFELTMSAIRALGNFKHRVQEAFPGKRAFVYGHHWGAAWTTNKRVYEELYHNSNRTSTRAIARGEHKDVNDYQWSAEAPIQFFTEDQLVHIADELIEQECYPEVNRQYIVRGASELCNHWNGPTLVEVYIDRALARGIPPLISICSDAHCPDDYGVASLEDICRRVPNIKLAQVWAENA